MAAKLEAMDAFSGLAERLVEGRLCGEVATPVGSCVGNCRQLVAGHPDYTFGLSDWATATYDEAVAALEALGGGRLRDHPDHAPAYIDPAGTVAGIRAHHDLLADFVARGGGRVLVATGHPVLLPHYGAVAAALAAAGCAVLAPAAARHEWTVRYVDGVAAPFRWGSSRHSHRPEYMQAMLSELDGPGDGRPDIVVADHGFAGAAIEAGVPTVSIADVNDPALPLAQARGRTAGVLLVDDGLPPDVFGAVTRAVLAWSDA